MKMKNDATDRWHFSFLTDAQIDLNQI